MSKLKEWLGQSITQTIVVKFLIPSLILLLTPLFVFYKSVLAQYGKVEETAKFHILLILVVLLFVGIAYIIILKKRLLIKADIKDYLFIDNPGYYVHQIDEGAFCQPCLLSGFAVRLSKDSKDSLHCRVCKDEI